MNFYPHHSLHMSLRTQSRPEWYWRGLFSLQLQLLRLRPPPLPEECYSKTSSRCRNLVLMMQETKSEKMAFRLSSIFPADLIYRFSLLIWESSAAFRSPECHWRGGKASCDGDARWRGVSPSTRSATAILFVQRNMPPLAPT